MGNPIPETDVGLWGLRPVRWGLRMLEPNAQILAASLSPGELRDAAVFLGLGLPPRARSKELAAQFAAAAEQRRQSLAQLPDGDSLLHENLLLLQRSLDLNEVEKDVIMFRAMLRLHPGFEALAGKYIGLCCDFVFHRRLATLFGVSGHDVTAALHKRGKLVESGLVSVIAGILGSLETRLRLMTGLIGSLMKPATSAGELLAMLLPRKRESHLELSSYPHLVDEIRLLHDHLGTALSRRAAGVNLLLHGSPGTGKTELAAALAASLGAPLYECAGADEDGESQRPRARMRHLLQLQRLVRIAGGGAILVDEAEDLFPSTWSDSGKVPTKATVNECLERNPVPVIWISNRTQHMEEAFLRRFDLVIHVSALPASAKCELLRNALPPRAIEERVLRNYANAPHLSPAMLSRLANVAASAEDATQIGRNLHVLSNHYLRTLGARPLATSSKKPVLDHDLALLNTDIPLNAVLATMTRTSSARMLLHGPPGTGKTALGEALAERLDKPLLSKQASSLLSCWLGETEKNLRDMFDEARRDDGVLLLDEADSFLGDRSRATTHYAVLQANELLTQMEAFDGIFVCTTNRLDDLDPAALRRFDLKIEFKPLEHTQRMRLIRQCCAKLGVEYDCDERALKASIQSLEGLTPGDAAAAMRRLALSGESPTLAALLDALATECRYKTHAKRPIGFAA